MKKTINYCQSCDASFPKNFSFCPDCATELTEFVMNPKVQNSAKKDSIKISKLANKEVVRVDEDFTKSVEKLPIKSEKIDRKKKKSQNANVDDRKSDSSTKSYARIGGWISLYIFFTVASNFFGILLAQTMTQDLASSVHNFWSTLGIIISVTGIIVALLLYTRSKIAILITKIYLVFLLFLNLFFLFLAYSTGKNVSFLITDFIFAESDLFFMVQLIQFSTGRFLTYSPNIFQSVILVSFVIIWLFYFSFSKRVKGTFIT